MDHGELFSSVRARPRMFNLDGSYASMVAFLTGYSIGNSSVVLHGFNGWLVVRLGYETSLNWPSLCLRIALPDGDSKFFLTPMNEEQNSRAVDVLFQLLEDFLEDTSSRTHG